MPKSEAAKRRRRENKYKARREERLQAKVENDGGIAVDPWRNAFGNSDLTPGNAQLLWDGASINDIRV